MFKEIPNIPYKNIHGVLEAIQPLKQMALKTKVGTLTPVYKVEDQGRMKLTPIKIDEAGKIKSLQLQEATTISTTVGDISCEFVTFYPDGSLRRLFPLNGKLSGYWSEANEYDLAKEILIKTSIGEIKVKPIYVHFYNSGELKSVTFWPKERIVINFQGEDITIKTGISFHKTGEVKSFEPASPITVKSPIGEMEVFDPDPMGINGEKNSLSILKDGGFETLSTVKSEIRVISSSGEETLFTPDVQRSRCNDEIFVVLPLKMEFKEGSVIFKHGFKTIGKVSIDSKFQLEDFVTDKPTASKQSCH